MVMNWSPRRAHSSAASLRKVLKVRAGEARRAPRDLGKVHVLGKRLVGGVDLQNVLAALDVGIADVDLAVKAAGTQQRGVEDVRAVGRRDER